MTAEDGEGGGQHQWSAMEDCFTDKWLRQETLCHRQWTDGFSCSRPVCRQYTLQNSANFKQIVQMIGFWFCHADIL